MSTGTSVLVLVASRREETAAGLLPCTDHPCMHLRVRVYLYIHSNVTLSGFTYIAMLSKTRGTCKHVNEITYTCRLGVYMDTRVFSGTRPTDGWAHLS